MHQEFNDNHIINTKEPIIIVFQLLIVFDLLVPIANHFSIFFLSAGFLNRFST